MTSLTERDLRQLILIQKKITLFEEGSIDLFGIIGDLGGLLNVLESVPDSWKDNFQSWINNLEIIYISIEDASIPRLKGDYKEDVRNIILKLKNMAISILEQYLERPDLNILEIATEGDSKWLICPKCHDAWESDSLKAMVICPKCECALHNPRTLGIYGK